MIKERLRILLWMMLLANCEKGQTINASTPGSSSKGVISSDFGTITGSSSTEEINSDVPTATISSSTGEIGNDLSSITGPPSTGERSNDSTTTTAYPSTVDINSDIVTTAVSASTGVLSSDFATINGPPSAGEISSNAATTTDPPSTGVMKSDFTTTSGFPSTGKMSPDFAKTIGAPKTTMNNQHIATTTVSPLAGCRFNGIWYSKNDAVYRDDCHRYICSGTVWLQTNETDAHCCYYPNWWWWNDNYWFGYSDYIIAYGSLGLNATLSNGACSGEVCVRRNDLEAFNASTQDCCEVDGYSYLPGERRYKDDCYEYVCQNSKLEKTNKTHPECCTREYDYSYYEYDILDEKYWQLFLWWYQDPEYFEYHSDYIDELNNYTWQTTLNEQLYDSNCQFSTCVSRNTWEPTGHVHFS
ncbi:hypothetical protein SK128_001860, partial [Halocaridina rubra]